MGISYDTCHFFRSSEKQIIKHDNTLKGKKGFILDWFRVEKIIHTSKVENHIKTVVIQSVSLYRVRQ